MTTSQRRTKQILIATVYAVINITLIASIVFTAWPRQPEEIVDAPEVPDPLTVTDPQLLPLDNGNADLIAMISNPNDGFGADQVRYEFVLQNAAGDEQTVPGTTFVLPGDRQRYVLALNYPVGQYSLVDFRLVNEPSWMTLSRFDLPELVVRQVRTGISQKAGNFFTLDGVVTNTSPYNLRQVNLVAIITSPQGEIVGVNRTFVRDVLATEAREFEMIWNDPIPDSLIGNVQVFPYSNVLADEEFLIRRVNQPVSTDLSN